MLSTHPKVGMAVLVGVRVKAKVWALARRDAHSFLAVRVLCAYTPKVHNSRLSMLEGHSLLWTLSLTLRP